MDSLPAAALVVHDLKNALGVLQAQLDQLAAAPEAARAREAAARCADLRRDFVAYLALYAGGTLRACCEDESPRELLAAFAARQAAPGGPIAIGWHCEPDVPPWAWLDHRLLGLALEAAVHNARRFARTTIELGLNRADGLLVFTVDDDGPGPGGTEADAADEAAALRAHSTGLGIGLCRAVAQAHGGAGDARLLPRPGGGARLELRIPAT